MPFRRGLAVLLLCVLPFLSLLGAQLVNWDDDWNLVDNYAFRGIRWQSLKWAFTTPHIGEYRPLAWVLYQVQYAIWGLRPTGYHAVSLLCHGLVAGLFAFLLHEWYRKTGKGISWMTAGLTALLFAVHPLRVEVVAWTSIQSYLPSVFFALLAIWFHLEGEGWNGKVALCLLVALEFKAIPVALPVVLLGIDWHLGRKPTRQSWEGRITCFGLAAVFAAFAVWAKAKAGALEMSGPVGLWPRLAQAAYGIVFYLAKTLFPADLSIYYRLPPDWAAPRFILCLLVVLAITAGLVSRRSRRPWLLLWMAYLALLAPNLGLARSGYFLAADRYSYFPLMILFVPIAAGLSRLLDRRPIPTLAGTGGLLILLGALTFRQTQVWRDSVHLWLHEVDRGSPSVEVLNNLGAALVEKDRAPEAEDVLRQALALNGQYGHAHYNLGLALEKMGQTKEAKEEFERVLLYDPTHAPALFHIGKALLSAGNQEEGTALLEEAVRGNPDYPEALRALAAGLAAGGDVEGARARLAEADRLERL